MTWPTLTHKTRRPSVRRCTRRNKTPQCSNPLLNTTKWSRNCSFIKPNTTRSRLNSRTAKPVLRRSKAASVTWSGSTKSSCSRCSISKERSRNCMTNSTDLFMSCTERLVSATWSSRRRLRPSLRQTRLRTLRSTRSWLLRELTLLSSTRSDTLWRRSKTLRTSRLGKFKTS